MDQPESKQQALPLGLGFDRLSPYNDLPLLPPSPAIETVRTLKAATGAARELAMLKGLGHIIPNQAVLIRAIALQEAKLSSEIENIVTTNDVLYKAFSDETLPVDPQTKEVRNYEEAVFHGIDELKKGRPLSTSLFTEIVAIIKGTNLGVRTMPGTIIQNRDSGETVYTPPVEAERIRNLLDNLGAYMSTDDGVDPLIRLCVSHYQFEAIHPFTDGNGRTGRVVNMLYLMQSNLLSVPTIYPSRYIIENKPAYLTGLRRVTEEGAWEDWVTFMLEGLRVSAMRAQGMVYDIRRALEEAVEAAKTTTNRQNHRELMEVVFSWPVIRIKNVVEAGLAQRHAAGRYLRQLEEADILSPQQIGPEVYFVNKKLMKILTE